VANEFRNGKTQKSPELFTAQEENRRAELRQIFIEISTICFWFLGTADFDFDFDLER
jgi:hypothetical protein